MKRALAAIILFGATGSASAVVTDYTIDGGLPVLLGERRTYRAAFADPAIQISSFKWEYQGVAKDGTPANWVVANSTSSNMWLDMGFVGKVNIRLTVKYSAPMGQPPHADTVVTHQVDVQPPDADVVVAGLSTPTALDQTGQTRVTVKFEMRAGGKAIGGQFDGYVQEYFLSWYGFNPVTDRWYPISYTPHWDPPVGESQPNFVRQGNLIIDKKATWCDAGWYAMFDPDFGFQTVSQKNRLVTTNWVGEEVIIELTTHNFTMEKSGDDTWILVEE